MKYRVTSCFRSSKNKISGKMCDGRSHSIHEFVKKNIHKKKNDQSTDHESEKKNQGEVDVLFGNFTKDFFFFCWKDFEFQEVYFKTKKP
jgi:hypothetical protein